MILACARRSIKFKRLPVDFVKQICKIIRDPGFGKSLILCFDHSYQRYMVDDQNNFSSNIREYFIPAISKLQDGLGGLRFSSVINEDIITERLQTLRLDPKFLCSNLNSSDIFFDNLKQK